jgi:hypothetical protein
LWVELLHAAGATPLINGDEVEIHYACLLARSATCMDSSRSKPCSSREPLRVRLGAGQVVPGMERGLRQLGLGDLARIHVPARLGYRGLAAGPIPPNSDLIFEVEIVGVNGQSTPGLPTPVLRALLMLPPAVMKAAPDSSPDSPIHHPKAAKAAADAMASVGSGVDSGDVDEPLPAWLTRLRGQGPKRPPESVLFEQFYTAKLGSEAAVVAAAHRGDSGASLVPYAESIAHGNYGTDWDGKAPIVLTGSRPGWSPGRWGWAWFEEHYGQDLVLCKQRAPIFEDDRSDTTLIAECTLREYMRCASPLHCDP